MSEEILVDLVIPVRITLNVGDPEKKYGIKVDVEVHTDKPKVYVGGIEFADDLGGEHEGEIEFKSPSEQEKKDETSKIIP